MIDITEELAKRRIKAKEELEKKSLRLPRRPTYDLPRLPSGSRQTITDLGDDALMELMARFSRYQDYVQGQLAQAEIDESSAESILEVAKARFLSATWTGATSERIAIAKAEATLDEDVREADEALAGCKAKRKMLGVLYDSTTRSHMVLSRELTRRVGREPTDRRGDRFRP